jgi:hypothetical protein
MIEKQHEWDNKAAVKMSGRKNSMDNQKRKNDGQKAISEARTPKPRRPFQKLGHLICLFVMHSV